MVLKARTFFLVLFFSGVAFYVAALMYDYDLKRNYVIKKNSQEMQSDIVSVKYWLFRNKSEVSWLSDPFVYSNLETEKDFRTNESYEIKRNVTERCPSVPPYLGPVVPSTIYDYQRKIHYGGYHSPSCIAKQRVAIVVAIHDYNVHDWKNNGFILYMHSFLMKQQIEYQIFVVWKVNTEGPVERGKLYNIGFVEAQTYRAEGWDCFIFHDVNILPLDTRNLYRCGNRPKNLIADCQSLYKFGGAVAISPRHFSQVNGFSNRMGKDVDYLNMYERLLALNLSVESSFNDVGAYMTYDAVHNFTVTNNGCTTLSNTLTSLQDAQIIQSTPISSSWNRSLESINTTDGLSGLFYNSYPLTGYKFYSLIEVKDDALL